MRLRAGILDITAAVLVLVAIVLPARSSRVERAYDADEAALRTVALEQARLAANPGDAGAAVRLSELLTERGQTDWAVQVSGEAAVHAGDDAWQTLLAVSIAHAERIEIRPAHDYAKRALDACRRLGDQRCPVHEEVRMKMYFEQLAAGVESGIDPRLAPNRYYEAVLRSIPVIRVRTGTPSSGTPSGDGGDGSGKGSGDGADPGTGTDPAPPGDHPGATGTE